MIGLVFDGYDEFKFIVCLGSVEQIWTFSRSRQDHDIEWTRANSTRNSRAIEYNLKILYAPAKGLDTSLPGLFRAWGITCVQSHPRVKRFGKHRI